jgi:hypothetical protein
MPKNQPKPDPELNPNGKEDFENLLRAALNAKPIELFGKNADGLLTQAEYARKMGGSRESIGNLIKKKDKRIVVVLVDDRKYIDPVASTWVPEKDKPVTDISDKKSVRVRKERPLGKNFVNVAQFAKMRGVTVEKVTGIKEAS